MAIVFRSSAALMSAASDPLDVRLPGGERTGPVRRARLAAIVSLLFLMLSIPLSAQEMPSIVLDDTLPGTVSEILSGPDHEIPASKGLLSGPNLFFSFSRFGLKTGESATFTGPASVARIVSRVTGPELSAIDGALRSEIAGASLYLLNPNGIVFGENATLDLSGAFHASTADLLEFEDGAEFHATFPERDSPLSVQPVAAFGFLSDDPAPIRIEGSRLVSASLTSLFLPIPTVAAEGQAMSLIGGDIDILGGGVEAPGYIFTGGARLDIASLDSPGRVTIVDADPANPESRNDLSVTPLDGEPLALGNVRIADSFALVTGGPRPTLSGLLGSYTRGSGDVFVRAHDMTIEDAEIRALTTSTIGAGRIDIDLTGDFLADGLGLNRTTALLAGSGLRVVFPNPPTAVDVARSVLQIYRGDVIDILIVRNELGQLLRVEYSLQGAGGAIEVDAENVSILNGAKLSSSGVFGGDGGAIQVVANDTVRLAGTRQDGEVGGIFSNAEAGGDSGSIRVEARTLELDALAGIFGEVSGEDAGGDPGSGGSIEVDVERLTIDGSGRIDTTTRGRGNGGRITINASDSVRLSGRQDDFNFSSVTTFSLPDESIVAGAGTAGTVLIDSPEISLAEGAGISTSAEGDGDAGVIDLRAQIVELSRSSITSAADLGTAGDIYLNGGPIDPATLDVQKPPGVPSGQRIVLDRSTISTSATAGSGFGGDIVIDPEFVVLRRSQIIARAVGGQGGNIVIVANSLVADAETVIDADSQFSQDGQVEINSSGQALRGDVETLPSTIPDVVDLLKERCAARRSGAAAGSFVMRGRDGLPQTPDDYLPAFHRPERRASSEVALIPIEDPEAPVEMILGCRVARG